MLCRRLGSSGPSRTVSVWNSLDEFAVIKENQRSLLKLKKKPEKKNYLFIFANRAHFILIRPIRILFCDL